MKLFSTVAQAVKYLWAAFHRTSSAPGVVDLHDLAKSIGLAAAIYLLAHAAFIVSLFPGTPAPVVALVLAVAGGLLAVLNKMAVGPTDAAARAWVERIAAALHLDGKVAAPPEAATPAVAEGSGAPAAKG